jgi:hypothetical protein
MLKCWSSDPLKFVEIYASLPDIKPEILKTVVANADIKKDHLLYNQGSCNYQFLFDWFDFW